MKVRTIALAAVGLLAVATAQAELQTWRFSGLLMSTDGELSPSATYGEDTQFDLTFDLDAVAANHVFASPLVSLSINGAPVTVGTNSLAPSLPYFSILNTTLPFGEPQGLTALQMRGGGAFDFAAEKPRPVNSVDEFIFSTYQLIDGYASFVFAGGITWREAVQIEWVTDGLPTIRLAHATGGAQLYALTSIQDVTPSVPEPSTWAMALLGGMGAATLARRRRSATAQDS